MTGRGLTRRWADEIKTGSSQAIAPRARSSSVVCYREDPQRPGRFQVDRVIRESPHGEAPDRQVAGHSAQPRPGRREVENAPAGCVYLIDELDAKSGEPDRRTIAQPRGTQQRPRPRTGRASFAAGSSASTSWRLARRSAAKLARSSTWTAKASRRTACALEVMGHSLDSGAQPNTRLHPTAGGILYPRRVSRQRCAAWTIPHRDVMC